MSEGADEIAVLRGVYEALNRNDVAAMVTAFDPQIEWDESGLPGGGRYRGLDEVRAHFAQARSQWAEGSCEPERFISAGDKIVVLVRVRARLKYETEWREGELADVYTFRDGRVVHVRLFLDRQQALAWAGASGEPV
jgi:ketosteroid isomerase-like protein